MQTITIINTGCANLSSVKFAFERLGYQAEITDDLAKIQSAEKLILPGVGTASAAMQSMQSRHLIETIQQLTQPVLGICLGMQLMTDYSAEGEISTLKLIQGKTELLPNKGLFKILFCSSIRALPPVLSYISNCVCTADAIKLDAIQKFNLH